MTNDDQPHPLYAEVGRAFQATGRLHEAAALGVGEAPAPVYAPPAEPGSNVTLRQGAALRKVPQDATETWPTTEPFRCRVAGAVGKWLAVETPWGVRFVAGDDVVKPEVAGIYGEIARTQGGPDVTTGSIADLVSSSVRR